jgi:delta(3,5)-delta(2,4)-dienoyl-CoA isomerase
MAISEFPRPVICAINGLCIGLGMDIATACDIRVCAEGATFSVREVKIGICADLGSLYFFPRVCRNDSWVREVCFTGRIFSATEARENGLVSAVIPGISLLKQAEKIAKSIEDNEPVAVEGTKINLNKGSRGTLRESMEFVSQWNSVRLQETDIIGRAISKFMQDRGKSKL